MISEIQHTKGTIAVKVNEVQSISYGKGYNDDTNEISIFINGFQNMYEIDSLEHAKEQYNRIVKLMADLSAEGTIETDSDNGYIKGFKDGCEYTLNLKETK